MNRLSPSMVCLAASALGLLGCSRSEPAKTTSASVPTQSATGATAPANGNTVVETKATPASGRTVALTSDALTKSGSPAAVDGLDLSGGAREALKVAANRAVEELIGPNGFKKSGIPLPDTLEKTRPYLKAVGKEDLLNNFSDAMNTAATDAIKQSPSVLNSTVQSMQLSDVTQLWTGKSDAFTRYMETHASAAIVEKMMPSIRSATEASGATRYFKQISSAVGEKAGGLMAGIQAATGVGIPANFDLDKYVADHAITHLFSYMAVEEKKLRENPAARSSQLLKSVFSHFEKP